MSDYDYDLFVIGAGSGGVRAARMSGALGARVAIAEDRYLGGTCVNVGCVPKKLFHYAAHYSEDFHDSAGYGWTVEKPKFDWQTLIRNKNAEIERLNGIYERLLENANVRLYNARATVVDPHTVEVDGEKVTAERILVAVGGWPTQADFPGAEHVISSNEAFYLDELPKRAMVLGGGYIAVEFAGIFNGLSVETTLVYRGEMFLRGFDGDVRHFLCEEVNKKGIKTVFHTIVQRVDKEDDCLRVTLSNGEVVETDLILAAIGRTPNTTNLGLENAGVELTEKGAVVVNEDFQSSVPSIYALGDVIDRVALTPVAIAEAMVFAHNTYNKESRKMDYRDIPTAVFSSPVIGTVGLTEAEAHEKYGKVDIYRTDFKPMKHTLSGGTERTMIKMIVDKKSDRVVGFHMIGSNADEVAQGIGVAFKAGATKADFDATIGIHPTSAEEFVTMRQPIPQPTADAAE